MKINDNLPEAQQLLEKYLQHTCSPEEEQQVLRWYFSFHQEDDVQLSHDEQDKILQSIKRKVLSVSTKSKVRQQSFQIRSIYIKVAALIAVCCTVAFSGKLYRSFTTETEVYQELKSAAGEHKSIVLEDGTRIQLNNASVLRYPVRFAKNRREVTLTGEAFFEVVHLQKKPFLVHTRQLKIQVLGTSFDVKAYPADKETVVSVATGKVAVSNKDRKVMLESGQKVILSRINNVFTMSADHTERARAWQHYTLSFRYETLESISHSLERWYGVKIIIANPKLLQKRYTLEQHHETLENVVKVLCADEFNYSIKGRSVTIW